MTAPVELTYDVATIDGVEQVGDMRQIAFFYPKASLNPIGPDGQITVEEVSPVMAVSLAVRGDYTAARFSEAIATLRTWLRDRPKEYVADGKPRILVYNNPFVPGFMRYSEIQIPVKEVAAANPHPTE